MIARKAQRKIPITSAVKMAIAAVEDDPNPLDMDLRGLDPAPTSLDLPEQKAYGGACPNSRCARPPVEACAECGQPLCKDCR